MNAPQNSTVSEIEDDDGQQTFDSPLQISLEKLVELQDRLANMKMRREARTLESVIRLLHTPDLLSAHSRASRTPHDSSPRRTARRAP